MEFFVASGDATKGFEPSEEIFDAVAFTIEMLVKRRFPGSAGVHGYDGDAAELVHISAVGVAVVALVHDGESAGPQMCSQEGFALVEVGDVGTREEES